MSIAFVIDPTNKNKFWVIFILTLLLGITYGNLINQDVILSYDDKVLLDPILKLHSLSEYFYAIKSGAILDLQPMRDLSYFFDYKLKALLPFYTFHLTNVILWTLTCFLAFEILLLQTNNFILSCVFLLIYCFSPVSSSSIAWIAARKHILSAFFILLATFIAIKKRERIFEPLQIFFITVAYFFSCISQPINVLWAGWLAYFTFNLAPDKNKKILISLNSLIGLIFLLSNYFYYTVIFKDNVSFLGKFATNEIINPGTTLLALGRYFYQCIFPFSALPTSHYQGSWENLCGLLALTLSLIFIFKLSKNLKKLLIEPLLFFFLPLLVVSLKPTNIFCSDTYLLSSSIGFYWGVALLINEKFKKNVLYGGLFIYASIIFIYNLNYVTLYLDEDRLWIYSQQKEANSQSTVVVASIHIKQKKFLESYLLIKKLQNEWPNQPFIPMLIAENVFFNPKIPNAKKIEILETTSPKSSSTYFYLSIIYSQEKQIAKLESVINKIFENNKNFYMEFHTNEEKVSAFYFHTCSVFHLKNCREQEIKKQLQKNNLWNENLFQEYLGLFATKEINYSL